MNTEKYIFLSSKLWINWGFCWCRSLALCPPPISCSRCRCIAQFFPPFSARTLWSASKILNFLVEIRSKYSSDSAPSLYVAVETGLGLGFRSLSWKKSGRSFGGWKNYDYSSWVGWESFFRLNSPWIHVWSYWVLCCDVFRRSFPA